MRLISCLLYDHKFWFSLLEKYRRLLPREKYFLFSFCDGTNRYDIYMIGNISQSAIESFFMSIFPNAFLNPMNCRRKLSLSTIDDNEMREISLKQSFDCPTCHHFSMGCKIVYITIFESFNFILLIF